jgi:hypothetical protein
MTGSVAFWYEPANGSTKKPPEVELHFNLWRDLIVRGSNYLDVGFLFKAIAVDDIDTRDDVSKTTDSFFLFFPGVFRLDQLSDLSLLMEHGSTLNAVFNDVVTITERHELYFKTEINAKPHLTFHKVNVATDIDIQTIETDDGRLGTIFAFKQTFCGRIGTGDDHYFRLRFVLDGRTRDLFTSDTQPSDWFVVSSFVRTELTEFRLNERRSFPSAIAERTRNFFDVVTVHYFLMRDLRFELADAHTNFRKMRRLEANLWRHYLRGTPPGQDPGWRVRRALARGAAKDTIIYHWRVGNNSEPVSDFIALARFRVPTQNLIVYAIIIGFLGGMGNAFYSIALGILSNFGLSPAATDQPTIYTNLKATTVLLVIALTVPLLLRKLVQLWTWLTDAVAELYTKFKMGRR